MNAPATASDRGTAPLPAGLRIAGMGTRVGAWLIDSLILGGFQVGFWLLALGVGALSVNPAAEQQMQSSPLTLPSVPPYEANLPLLAVMLSVFAVLNVAYAAAFWAWFRGMPGQRIMSLQVGSATTGRNLSPGRALIRSIAVLGVPAGAVAGVLYGVFAFETSVPWSDVLNPVPGGPAEAWLTRWSVFMLVGLLLVAGWPVVLLVSTGVSRTRQGLHDRMAGSLVVGRTSRKSWSAGYRSRYRTSPGGYPGSPSDGFGPTGYPPPPVPGPPQVNTPGGAPTSPTPADAGPGPQPPVPTGLVPRWLGGWTDPNGTQTGGPSRPEEGSVWLRTEDSEAAPTIHSARIGKRVTAYLFDCVLVYMIFSLTSTAITASLVPSAATNVDDKTLILLGLVGGFEQLAYFVSGWVVWQGTLGQRLMHIRTAQATTGKAIGWMDGLVRWTILQGPFALMTIVPSGLRIIVLMAATPWSLYLLYTTQTDPDKRGLHDRFLDSRVVDDFS